MWVSRTVAERCTPSAPILSLTLKSLLGLFSALEHSELPKTRNWCGFALKGCEKSLTIGRKRASKRGLNTAGRNWLSKLAVGTTHPDTFIPDEHMMEQQTWTSGWKNRQKPTYFIFCPPIICLSSLTTLPRSFALPPFSAIHLLLSITHSQWLSCPTILPPWPSHSSVSDSRFTLPACFLPCTTQWNKSKKPETWFPVSHNPRSAHLDLSILRNRDLGFNFFMYI